MVIRVRLKNRLKRAIRAFKTLFFRPINPTKENPQKALRYDAHTCVMQNYTMLFKI